MILVASTCMAASLASAGTMHDVSVGPGGAFVFAPVDIVVEVGDTVRWTWDSCCHNVGSGLPGAPTPAFLSGAPVGVPTTFEVLFDQAFLDANPIAGNFYDYHCHPHGAFGMIGSVEVQLPCPADIDGSSDVGFGDLLAVLSNWGMDGPGADIAEPQDIVDFSDLVGLLAAWGPCP